MTRTILGLWAAVDAGWQDCLDRNLFGVLRDAYLDAGDQVAADAVEWLIQWNRVPLKTKSSELFYWIPYSVVEWDHTTIGVWTLPKEFRTRFTDTEGGCRRNRFDAPSKAYTAFVDEWAKLDETVRQKLMSINPLKGNDD